MDPHSLIHKNNLQFDYDLLRVVEPMKPNLSMPPSSFGIMNEFDVAFRVDVDELDLYPEVYPSSIPSVGFGPLKKFSIICLSD